MKSYFTVTRRGLLCVLAAIILFMLLLSRITAIKSTNIYGRTNKQRIDFIKSIGLSPKEEAIGKKQVVIPQTFGEVYNNYNKIQIDAGFNLLPYKGCEVTVYTYSVDAPNGYDGEAMANLIVYRDRIIGGDVSSAALNGYMLKLGDFDEKTKTG